MILREPLRGNAPAGGGALCCAGKPSQSLRPARRLGRLEPPARACVARTATAGGQDAGVVSTIFSEIKA
jgi:hypothetical protein